MAPGRARARPVRPIVRAGRRRLARPLVAAAVDIGSNSAHLLVAVVRGRHIEPLVDESVFLGLGDAVSRDGVVGPERSRRLAGAVAGYAASARFMGATRLVVVGTEPLRRATDTPAVVATIARRHLVPIHVLDHEEEALLTLLGVTGGRPLAAPIMVADVGGGSSEIVFATPGREPLVIGLRIGSAALTTAHVAHDPPMPDEVRGMRAAVREALGGLPAAQPQEVILVGGTASNLVRLIPAATLDRRLSRPRIRAALAELVASPAGAIAARHAIRPERARTMAAGATIVAGLLERYRTRRVRVSEAGIREGAILAVAHAGSRWRRALPGLTAGWPASGEGQSRT